MKFSISFFVISSLLLIGCNTTEVNHDTEHQEKPKLVNPFHWLGGDWDRCNDPGLLSTSEKWQLVGNNAFKGLGFTLDHGDTIFKENMTFVEEDSSWVLTVFGVNDKPTAFKLVEQTENSFHVSNPQNKFPTDIKYSINGDTLEAVVFNADEEILFQFVHPNE